MIRARIIRAGAACFAAMALATAATAQHAPAASADDVVAGATACIAATAATGTDGAKLTAVGWREARNNPPGVRFFAKPPSGVLISVENAGRMCGVSAGLTASGTFADIVTALTAKLGAPRTGANGIPNWTATGIAIRAMPMTGPDGGPSVRVSVTPATAKAK